MSGEICDLALHAPTRTLAAGSLRLRLARYGAETYAGIAEQNQLRLVGCTRWNPQFRTGNFLWSPLCELRSLLFEMTSCGLYDVSNVTNEIFNNMGPQPFHLMF